MDKKYQASTVSYWVQKGQRISGFLNICIIQLYKIRISFANSLLQLPTRVLCTYIVETPTRESHRHHYLNRTAVQSYTLNAVCTYVCIMCVPSHLDRLTLTLLVDIQDDQCPCRFLTLPKVYLVHILSWSQNYAKEIHTTFFYSKQNRQCNVIILDTTGTTLNKTIISGRRRPAHPKVSALFIRPTFSFDLPGICLLCFCFLFGCFLSFLYFIDCVCRASRISYDDMALHCPLLLCSLRTWQRSISVA